MKLSRWVIAFLLGLFCATGWARLDSSRLETDSLDETEKSIGERELDDSIKEEPTAGTGACFYGTLVTQAKADAWNAAIKRGSDFRASPEAMCSTVFSKNCTSKSGIFYAGDECETKYVQALALYANPDEQYYEFAIAEVEDTNAFASLTFTSGRKIGRRLDARGMPMRGYQRVDFIGSDQLRDTPNTFAIGLSGSYGAMFDGVVFLEVPGVQLFYHPSYAKSIAAGVIAVGNSVERSELGPEPEKIEALRSKGIEAFAPPTVYGLSTQWTCTYYENLGGDPTGMGSISGRTFMKSAALDAIASAYGYRATADKVTVAKPSQCNASRFKLPAGGKAIFSVQKIGAAGASAPR